MILSPPIQNIKIALALRNKDKKRLKRPLRQLHPLNAQRAYTKDLREIVQLIRVAVDKLLISQLPNLLADVTKFSNRPFRDDVSDDTNAIFDKIKVFLNTQVNAEQIAQLRALNIDQFNAGQWRKQIMHMFGINIFTTEPWLKDHLDAWIGANVGLIKSLQDTALSRIHYQVQQGFMQGLRYEVISKNIQEQLGITERRANLIARDQTSKLNGQLTEFRQRDVGVNEYIWNTAHDERVRDSHREKQGKKFSWDNPPADTGHPGEDYNCRCVALPIFSADLFE